MFDTSEESDEEKQREPTLTPSGHTGITMLPDTSISTFSAPSIETCTVATDILITTDVTSDNSALAFILLLIQMKVSQICKCKKRQLMIL